MDRSQDMFATLSSVIAELSGARASQRRSDGESDSLLGMLSNPNFIPPQLRAGMDVRDHPPAMFDDLPPLEDDGAPVSLPSTNHSSGHRLPNLDDDDDEPPPLEDDDSSIESQTVAQPPLAPVGETATPTSAGPFSDATLQPIPFVAPSPLSVQSSAPGGVFPTPTNSGGSTTRPTRGSANDEDDGAESDSSLPSLQSVSDSSSEEGDYVNESESDWDDDESVDESDEEANITRIIDDAERIPPEAPPNPRLFLPFPPTNVRPSPGFDPDLIDSTMQSSYRELLERARGIIPDLESRFPAMPDLLTDLTMRIAGVDNDPHRAETLLGSMEVVPNELVVRYEKLRSTDGEDVDGCAICRDDLADKSPDAVKALGSLAVFALLPFHSEIDSIVAFPCAGKHIFHKYCLSPWLARKTTCPTCRFDIDPLSLTLRISGGLRDAAFDAESDPTHPPRIWQPPRVESMRDWLEAEEKAKGIGIPRQRPGVVMPEYPPLQPPTGILANGAAPPRPMRPAGAPLSDILETPAWGINPDSGTFDMMTAYDDIQEIRQQFLNMDARRERLDSIFQIPRTETPEGVPTRPPSAPPVPSSGASRPMNGPSSPPLAHAFGLSRPLGRNIVSFGSNGTGNREYQRLRQQIAMHQHGEHVVPYHNFTPRMVDRLVHLRSTPVSRDPPPDEMDVDALTDVDRRLAAIRQELTAAPTGPLSQIFSHLQDIASATELDPISHQVPSQPPATPSASETTATSTTFATFDTAHAVSGGQGGVSTLPSPATGGDGIPHLSSYNPADDLD